MIDKKLLKSLEECLTDYTLGDSDTDKEEKQNLVRDFAEKLKVLSLTDEEHEFLVGELSENRIRSQELLDDEIIALDNAKSASGGYQDSIDGYKKEVRLFDAIIKKL